MAVRRLSSTLLFLFIISSCFPIFLDMSDVKGELKYPIESIIEEESHRLERLWGFRANVVLKVKIVHFEYRGECISRGKKYEILINPEFVNYRNTIRHELMHLYNFEWEKRTGIHTPLWIVEGLAMMWENQLERNVLPSPKTILYLWKTNILRMDEYPKEMGEFYSSVHLFMIYLDGKLRLFQNFRYILNEVEKYGDWEKAFSGILKEGIDDLYGKFRLMETFLLLMNPNTIFYVITSLFIVIVMIKIVTGRRKRMEMEEEEEEDNWWDL